jgi:hypothetical protein
MWADIEDADEVDEHGEAAADGAETPAQEHGTNGGTERRDEAEEPTIAERAEYLVKLARSSDRVSQQKAKETFREWAFRDSDPGKACCHAAQRTLEAAPRDIALTFALEFRGDCFVEAVHSKQANHVVQRMVEVLPSSHGFVVDELKRSRQLSRHRFGCRVFCKLLEHSHAAEVTPLLEDILSEEFDGLCCDKYGSIVIRSFLTHRENKGTVARALMIDILRYSRDEHGSHVVEAALRLCSLQDRADLIFSLVYDTDGLANVASSRFGRRVVACALTDSPIDLTKAVLRALPAEQHLKAHRWGKSVVKDMHLATRRVHAAESAERSSPAGAEWAAAAADRE